MKKPFSPEASPEMSANTIERIPPESGGTVIIMQRHGEYDRQTGHLTEGGKENALERSRAILEEMLEGIPENERSAIELLVVASPTQLNGGQRSLETAEMVLTSARAVFSEHGIPTENILSQNPRAVAAIEQPRMFDDKSGYREFLADKYGDVSKEFWQAFEDERHQAEREEFGSEGPLEMSDRFAHFTNVLARFARLYHHRHEDSPQRLLIWNVSHYDTVTTFFKNHVADIDQKEYVPVDYDGGMALSIDAQGNASTSVGGHRYPVQLTQRGTKLARHQSEDSA